ncbi:MAG: copper homeostasis protein CutC [Planctomycetes bacterium]|nr:copper homeostasis protein CutC [Planctomycetota bacterium]
MQQLGAHGRTILRVTTAANEPVIVEVAVESATGAAAAAAGGAQRLELCQALDLGGLTPSPGLVAVVKAAVPLPVFVMIRPRPGDFLYDDGEFAAMRRDVEALRRAGGEVHAPRLTELVAAAGGAPVTFHRAIDVAAAPERALESLVTAGVARVLTSGQANTAAAGVVAIRRLVLAAAGRLVVMAGAGVRDGNVRELVAATGVREVHLSAAVRVPSAMVFRRDGVVMGATALPDEFSRRQTDADLVARVVAAVRGA